MPAEVVTAFLRNRGEVLLVRRSREVGTYRRRWGGISGYVEPEGETRACPDAPETSGWDAPETSDWDAPETSARREIAEETGLLGGCTLVRRGEPFVVEDEATDRVWRVHPFLFDCEHRAIEPSGEIAELDWTTPTAILRRETVPALWTSYDRVRPTVETIRSDDVSGSTTLSIRALEVLRDRAGELIAREGPSLSTTDAWAELTKLAETLLETRPGMAALTTRIDRAMAAATDRDTAMASDRPTATAVARTPEAVEESTRRGIERALGVDERAAVAAVERMDGGRILTLSRSGTVLGALLEAPVEVVVAESRPGDEGVGVAERLAAEGKDVTLIPDAAVAHRLVTDEIDAVLVGADTVLADGRVVNKIGTRAAAIVAAREGAPFSVVAARDKVAPTEEFRQEFLDPGELYAGDADLAVETALFDVTPADLVTTVITEDGPLDRAGIEAVADEHDALAEWRR